MFVLDMALICCLMLPQSEIDEKTIELIALSIVESTSDLNEKEIGYRFRRLERNISAEGAAESLFDSAAGRLVLDFDRRFILNEFQRKISEPISGHVSFSVLDDAFSNSLTVASDEKVLLDGDRYVWCVFSHEAEIEKTVYYCVSHECRLRDACANPGLQQLLFGVHPMAGWMKSDILGSNCVLGNGAQFKRTVEATDDGSVVRCEFDAGGVIVLHCSNVLAGRPVRMERTGPGSVDEGFKIDQEIDWRNLNGRIVPVQTRWAITFGRSLPSFECVLDIETVSDAEQRDLKRTVSRDAFGTLEYGTRIRSKSDSKWMESWVGSDPRIAKKKEVMLRANAELLKKSGFLFRPN